MQYKITSTLYLLEFLVTVVYLEDYVARSARLLSFRDLQHLSCNLKKTKCSQYAITFDDHN